MDVVRPDEDSQVREEAEACRVEAPDVDSRRTLSGMCEERMYKKEDISQSSQWRKRKKQR